MAVDVYSENFVGIKSPTFSFSNDFQKNETTSNPIDSAFDFAFSVEKTIYFESSTADELFCDGKMLPSGVKKQEIVAVSCLDSESKSRFEPRKKCLKEFLEDDEEEADVVVPKPFWKFRRSNSLNCDRNQKKGLIGSWKILSRSGSTGKFLEKILEENEEKPNNNNTGFFGKFSRSSMLWGDFSNQVFVTSGSSSDQNVGAKNCTKLSGEVLKRSNSISDNYVVKSSPKLIRRSKSTGSAPNQVRKKKHQHQHQHQYEQEQEQEECVDGAKSVKKGQVKNGGYNFGNYYSNNGKVNTGLNLPSPYISRVSVDLFGMGSLFCNGSTKYRGKKRNDKF